MACPPERTAVLVIRAWLEKEDGTDPARFRARISSTADVSESGPRDTISATSETDVVNAVRSWMRAFVAGR